MKLFLILIGGYYALALSIALIPFSIKYISANYKKIVDFEMTLEKGTTLGNEYYYVIVKASFYDEPKHFYFGFGLLKFSIAFVPVETIPAALKELLKDKYLYQTQWDSAIPRGSSMLSETINKAKVGVAEGLFIYSPASIELDALRGLGFTDGQDIFFMTNRAISRKKIETYKEKLLEWDKLSHKDSVIERRKFFESEGEIVKYLDRWQIIHRDEEFARKAINLICQAAGDKAIRKAKLNRSFSMNKDFSQFFPFVAPVRIRAYIENEKLVLKGATFKEKDGKFIFDSRTFTEEFDLQ